MEPAHFSLFAKLVLIHAGNGNILPTFALKLLSLILAAWKIAPMVFWTSSPIISGFQLERKKKFSNLETASWYLAGGKEFVSNYSLITVCKHFFELLKLKINIKKLPNKNWLRYFKAHAKPVFCFHYCCIIKYEPVSENQWWLKYFFN